MAGEFINAAPMSNLQGIKDESTRLVPVEPEVIPQHLPKIYVYAQTGPTTPQLVIGNGRNVMYGDDTFNMRKKYANHATKLSNILSGQAQMIERIKPLDAGPNAALRLYADVLPTQVQDYVRNSDGSYKTDGAGAKIPTAQKVPGFLVKYVLAPIPVDVDGVQLFGQGVIVAGDQTDADTATQSQRYPIADGLASHFGADGNNLAMRTWSPTVNTGSGAVDKDMLQRTRAYPYRFAFAKRKNDKSAPALVATRFGEYNVVANLKPGSFDDVNDRAMYAGAVVLNQYQALNAVPPVFGPFGELKFYDNYIADLLEMFYEAEFPLADEFTDFTGEDDETYKFNLFGGHSSEGVPYHSYQVISGVAGSVRLSEASNLYAVGGSDGTMNDTLFAERVVEAISGYADQNNIVQDTAKYPESFFWDTGFPMDAKQALAKFIAIRKDTAVVLATSVAGERKLTASEDSARATALKTYLQQYPESEIFGTKTVRGAIVSRSGILADESMGDFRLPLTFDLAKKVSDYMGAGDGKWVNGKSFDTADGDNNVVTMFRDISVTFTPKSVRNLDWAAGMTYVESFDTRRYYYPAVHTVYENDTSILIGFQTMVACLTLTKIQERGRRQFSGNQSLTNEQFAERLDRFCDARANGIFDGKLVTKSRTFFTEADVARNYSYTNVQDLYGPGMKTVGTFSIAARRIEDLPAAA